MGRSVSNVAAAASSSCRWGFVPAALHRGHRTPIRALMLAAVLALPLVASGSALATTGHRYAGQFGGPGNGTGEFAFGGPSAVAVRQSTGDVFVADGGHALSDGTPAPRIERFNAGGDFQSSFAIDPNVYSFPGAVAIDPGGSASVYVAASDNATGAGTVLKYSSAGVFAYALDASASGTVINNPAAIAVDPVDGTVFATATDSVTGATVIDSFDQTTGAFVASNDGATGSPDGGFLCPSSLAADASDGLYVLDGCKGRVDRYTAAGGYSGTIDSGSGGPPVTVTADPISGDVFVGEFAPAGLQITHLAAGGGTPPQSFGAPHLSGLAGLAVDHASGSVYAAENFSAVIERFSAFAGATVSTTAAAAIDPTSETLNGTIDPGGVPSSYHFDYGPDTNYGTSTSEADAGRGSGSTGVDAAAMGLIANTTYHYRIVGTNDLGSIVGNDQTFTTAPAHAIVDGSPSFASGITSTGATINGTVNPSGSPTSYYVDYGTTTAYDNTAPQPAGDAGSGGTDTPVTATLTGLTPGTTYHFRIVADNGTGGAQAGADGTFSTAPATPGGATSVTAGAATLTGTINPHGSATTYHFNYGTTTSYGSSTPDVAGGSGSADEPVTAAITGLQPSTTYHVQVIATTNGQTTTGDDGTFETAPAPIATATSPTGVSTSAATLTGTADTHGLAGTYRFLVTGVDGSYSHFTDAQPVPGGSGARPVTAVISDLPSGQALRVTLRVTSNDATTSSDEITFATAPMPPSIPPPPAVANRDGYGCATPVLRAYDGRPKPGDTIVIAGTDLGVGGSVALGAEWLRPMNWSATGFIIQIPADATGTLPLTINCGTASNTIAVAVYKRPDNAFAVKATVSGNGATLSIKVPGAGRVTASGQNLRSAKASAKKAGTVKMKVSLSAAAVKSLARHHRLKITATVRFTPMGGATASKRVSLSFKRKAR